MVMSPLLLRFQLAALLNVTVCQPGLSGIVDHCKLKPCKNNGHCEERVDGYVCQCSTGFTGMHCDIVDSCESSPCLHGGRCVNTKTNYVCDCAGTGYGGFTCHVSYDDCQSHPCLHGGTCADGFKNFTCTCVPGFAGKTCETELSACVSNPCQHGGTCVDTHPDSKTGQISPGFQCQCVEGIAGDRCQTNYDDCLDKPCQHGTCIDGINSYTCDCTGSGYSGDRCQRKNTAECLLHPCQNGGTCVQKHNDYSCTCPPFQNGLVTHGGKNCSVLLRGCADVHACQHSGICVPLLLNEATNLHGYKCSCAPGFIGRVCDRGTTLRLETGSYIRKMFKSEYKMSLRFRTAEENGVLLYNRIGQGFVSVEVVNSSLFLVSGDSSGYNETLEVVTTSEISNAKWHRLQLIANTENITLTLEDKLCNTTDSCSLSIMLPVSTASFRELFLGQVTVGAWLKNTYSQTQLASCVQDVFFNNEVILPDNYGIAEFHKVKIDCPVCLPNACKLGKVCSPLNGTDFECRCSTPLVNGVCIANEVTCNFDNGLCGWHQDSSDNFDWTRYRGSTPSSNTGPSGDHTSGSGYYMYTEASNPSSGSSAILYSNRFNVGSAACVRFWVHMYGSSMGSLNLYQRINGGRHSLVSLSGSYSTSWFQRSASLSRATNTYLEFYARTGSSYYSDISIDDVTLTYTSC